MGDRPAQESAEEEIERKTGFEPNAAETPAATTDSDAKRIRRFTLLQAFVRAGRAILKHFAPAPSRPLPARGKKPPPDNQPH